MKEVLDFLSRWDLALVPAVAVLAAATSYLWAVRRLAHRQPEPPWPRWRTSSFLTGLALLAFVVMGPVGAFDDELFWAHMVQHIAIMMLVAPLLLLGAPVLLALRTSGRATRRRLLVPALRSRPVRLLTNPVLTWVLFAGALIGTHFTPFYNYAVTHPVVHDYVEHPLYLGVALLYFYPLIGANPVPHGPSPLAKVASLVLMMGPEAMTGFFIYTARGVLYPAYAVSPRPFGLDALSDQQLGGGLMWCSGMVIGALWIAVAIQAWLRAEARKGRRIDRQIAAGLTGPAAS
ncbi:cytochrome c oxidase assembly protein [Oryzihumus leptocrescens]|uniref:Putative copper resistance protein D n=1 Tax=Oryzihumus leptocrescens TaxID=297536 RepID=A0A542ZF95_9MICO|nr:cytochrome c oxidase assembly protein [Oryzihumus leptocrescens]TQL58981.1 putative copper resistance protein D [Oryzihumus leptocrescens]